MRVFTSSLLAVAGISVLQATDLTSSQTDQLKDADLVRFYVFEEGKGDSVQQLAGDKDGELFLVQPTSPYGEPIDWRVGKWNAVPEGSRGVEWTDGRVAGTHAIRPGKTLDSVVHSRFYKTPSGSFSLAAWVRPREGWGSFLWAGPYMVEEGYKLGGDAHRLWWRVATTEGPVMVDTAALTKNVWHQVVGTWNAQSKTLQLYVDGVLAAEKTVSGSFIPPKGPEDPAADPPDDIGGLRVGGCERMGGEAADFDIDELAIYGRALSAEEVTKLYDDGKPKTSVEEQQIAAQAAIEKSRLSADTVIALPTDSYGYFAVGKPFDLRVQLPKDLPLHGDVSVAYSLVNLEGKTVKEETKVLPLKDGVPAELKVPFTLSECGLYFLHVAVKRGDALLKEQEFPIGIMVALPPIGERPKTSPLGAHGGIDLWPESATLGFGIYRVIRGDSVEPQAGVYDFSWEDKAVDLARERGMDVMLAMNVIPESWDEGPGSGRPGDAGYNLSSYKALMTAMVKHFKGRVKYWEVVNEPNSGHHGLKPLGTGAERAQNYVKLLKAVHEIVRKEDPDALVVGINGCPNFVPWVEEVFAAGGAPYFDILTVHNYRPSPILTAARENGIGRVREIMKSYGKDCPLWNGEFGIHQPRRVNGRPMPADDLWKYYPGRLGESFGSRIVMIDMPTVTELVAAQWTVQAALLDLAEGADRFCLLAGPNRFVPSFSQTQGTPSEMGVALAAMASVVMPMKSAERFPLTSIRDAGVVIEDLDGKRTAAFFSDDQQELVLKFPKAQEVQGMDWLGNALSWKVADDGILRLPIGPSPVYLKNFPEGVKQVALIHADGDSVLKDGKLEGSVTLTNPGAKDFAGRIKVEAPAGISVALPAEIRVKAGAEEKIPFTLEASNLKRGKHEVSFTLEDGEGDVVARSQHVFEASDTMIGIPKVGRLGEVDWDKIPPVVIDDEAYVLSGKPVPGVPWAPQWRGKNDLSLTYRLGWNPEDGLLVRVEVTDDKFRPAPEAKLEQMYRYDCVELFVDLRPDNLRRDGYSPGAEQILVRPPDSEKDVACTVRSMAHENSQLEANFTGHRTPTGYVLSGAIKPKAGTPWKIVPGERLGLDMFVDDADDDIRKTIMGLGFGGTGNATSSKDWGWFRPNP